MRVRARACVLFLRQHNLFFFHNHKSQLPLILRTRARACVGGFVYSCSRVFVCACALEVFLLVVVAVHVFAQVLFENKNDETNLADSLLCSLLKIWLGNGDRIRGF